MKFFVTESLGPKQHLTKEGFLLCEDAPLARTGSQLYGAEEIYGDSLPNGIAFGEPVTVDRVDAEVFRPETIASFQGKPVVDEHPEIDGKRVDVTPDNFRDLAVGHILNPRRGEGSQGDLLIGDLLITHGPSIAKIRAGKRELSCGYDADYYAISDRHLEQRNILGNHVALVDEGRCGPRCAIGDRRTETVEGDTDMATTEVVTKPTLRDRAFAAVMKVLATDEGVGGGEGAKEKEAQVTQGDATRDAIDALSTRMGALEDSMKSVARDVADMKKGRDEFPPKKGEEKEDKDKKETKDADYTDKGKDDEDEDDKEKTEDAGPNRSIEGSLELEAPPGTAAHDARKARDSQYLSRSFQETVAMVEIITPGLRTPRFDRAERPRKTFDSICKMRRDSLALAWTDAKTRGFVEDVNGGKPLDLDKMTCDQVRPIFLGVAALKRQANNRAFTDSARAEGQVMTPVGGVKSISDLQKKQDDFWAAQKSRH